MTHSEIKRWLHWNDSSFGQVARELQVSRTLVWKVSKGESQSERVKRAIASKIKGKTYQEIWG